MFPMHRNLMIGGLAFALFAGLMSVQTASAQNYAPRQYYSDWHPPAQGQSHYTRKYYSKPAPDYSGYRTHEVHYFPAKPKHYYYYNPQQKKYWGRCPTEAYGKPSYSLLKMEDRKADLNAIPESAFPPPSPKMPAIPDSNDGAVLDLPPEDVPGIAATSAP